MFSLCVFLKAQVQTEWLKSYGNETAQTGYQTLNLGDGTIILIGITEGIDTYTEEVLIVKISISGDTLLTRKIGKSRNISTPAICPTSDSGFIVSFSAKRIDKNLHDIYISKFDSNANIVWNKKYISIANETVKSIKQTKEGFIMLGEHQALFQQSHDTKLLLFKVDTNGDSLWVKKISQVGSGKSIAVSPENGYAFIGNFGDKVTKTDENGIELWQKDFSSNNTGNYIEATNDGGYIITGVSNSKLMLLKMDSDGNIEWIRQYGENAKSIGFCVRQVSGGCFIATGQITNDNGDTAIYIVKTNDIGELLWTFIKRTEMPKGIGMDKTVKPPIPVDDKNYIEEIYPGQYVIVGTVIDEWDWDFGLLKLTDLTFKNESINQMAVPNFELSQNYPNPFNYSTLIKYKILHESYIRIIVYDLMGNEIKNIIDDYHQKGQYKLQWNGIDNLGHLVSGGIYFYKLQSGNYTQARKMLFLK